MMRVLLIANTLPPRDVSGVGEQVLQLAAGLRELGDEVEVLGRGPRGAAGPKVLFPLTIVPAAWRALRRFRPHVVQVHESDGALAALLVRATRNLLAPRPLLTALLQVSYVEELRAVRPLAAGGKVLGRPGGVEMRFRWLKASFQILLGLITARAADLVLAPSEATAAELQRDYRAGEVGVIPNVTGGLEIAPAGEVEGAPGYLLFVGRLRIRKGVEVLLEALRELRRSIPGAALRIAGDGEHRAALERAAADLGPAVSFLGTRSSAQVRTLLRGAAALVVPSIYEGMPLVVLEAMEAGVPVVASAVSGIPEVVVGGETGWLVPPEDPEALARALEEVLADPGEARRRGEAGRQRVAERYRPAAAAASWRAAVERRSEGVGPGGVG
jgi:glycosyltransferase involved in cell wall biosynthesis